MTRVKEFCTSQFAIPLSQSIVKIKNRVATLKNILSQKYYLNYEYENIVLPKKLPSLRSFDDQVNRRNLHPPTNLKKERTNPFQPVATH